LTGHRHDEDRDHLHSLGYAQELHRGLGTFSNFAISFSIISILAGGMTSFWLGMRHQAVRWSSRSGWVIVGFFALLVGMAMGEICSAYPTAGGLYYWSAKLAKERAAVGWFTGWFNFIGQIGVIASVDYALANFIGVLHQRMFDDGFELTDHRRNLRSSSSLVLMLTPTVCSTRSACKLVKILGDISVWWHVVGVAIIFGVLFIGPETTSSIGATFDEYQNNRPWTGGTFVTSTCSRSGLPAGAVHDHRLRCVGARERGDRGCSHRAPRRRS
jgi:amino acid transporter